MNRLDLTNLVKQMAFYVASNAQKRRSDFQIPNPCFRGDMKLLTIDGYKTFEELDGKNVNIINKDGEISLSKVWCSGIKETVEIKFKSMTKTIYCTPDHVFMLSDGEECMAKDLEGKIVKGYSPDELVYEVESVNPSTSEKVYDFTEPLTHWGVVENIIVHNCGEILLVSEELCNLTTVNVLAFVENGILDKKALLKAQGLSARAGYRMTCVTLELNNWDINQKRDRLIGCSLTGWQDMINATNMNREDEIKLLQELRIVVHQESEALAKSLNQNKPLLATTIKPEGTLSLLPTVSSGLHYSHSDYYIRRIRINNTDPLLKVMEELEYPIFPDNGEAGKTTSVIEFPVKSPKGKTKYEVTAIAQLENYKMFQEHYTDHNSSITVSVREQEWEGVEQWLWDNWECVIGISFLSLDDSYYPLLPYEAITEEEYNKRVSVMTPFKASLLQKYEKVEETLDVGSDEECSSGSCPIR